VLGLRNIHRMLSLWKCPPDMARYAYAALCNVHIHCTHFLNATTPKAIVQFKVMHSRKTFKSQSWKKRNIALPTA